MACRQRAGRAGGTFASQVSLLGVRVLEKSHRLPSVFARHVSNVEESTFSTGVNVKCVFLWGGGGVKLFGYEMNFY